MESIICKVEEEMKMAREVLKKNEQRIKQQQQYYEEKINKLQKCEEELQRELLQLQQSSLNKVEEVHIRCEAFIEGLQDAVLFKDKEIIVLREFVKILRMNCMMVK